MRKRAERMLVGLEAVREQDRVAKIKFPDPAPCGKTPLIASNLSKSFGSMDIFAAVEFAIDKESKVVVIGLNGEGKTTLIRLLAGEETPDTGLLEPGHGLKVGSFAHEHETLGVNKGFSQKHTDGENGVKGSVVKTLMKKRPMRQLQCQRGKPPIHHGRLHPSTTQTVKERSFWT